MKLKRFSTALTLLLMCCFVSLAQDIKKIAILETVSLDPDIKNGVKLLVQSRMATAITELGGYEAYNRVDMSQIMEEHEFQRSGYVNDEQIKRIGEMHGVDYILITKVAYVDDENILIISQIIDIETAKVVGNADAQTSPNGDDLSIVCQEIAKRLLNIELYETKVKSQQASEQVTINSIIYLYFNHKSYNIEFEEDPKIWGIVEYLKNNPTVNIAIAAFQNGQFGSYEENYNLCMNRLSMIVEELISQYDINPDRITSMYYGEMVFTEDYPGVLICSFK